MDRTPTITTINNNVLMLDDVTLHDVDIKDIAISLAHQCRFNGHVMTFYSVAEHCLLMADYFEKRGDIPKAMEALMHDCGETFVGDVISPIKKIMPDIVALENRITGMLLHGLELDFLVRAEGDDYFYVQSPAVRDVDHRMSDHEKWYLRPKDGGGMYHSDLPFLRLLSPEAAASAFVHRFYRYKGELANGS